MLMLKVPKYPISVIDFHGTDDDTIPYDVNSPECVGEGPQGNSIFTKIIQDKTHFHIVWPFHGGPFRNPDCV